MFLSGFNYNEKCAFFSLAKNIAEADENISKNEDNLLRQYLGEMSLNIEQITDITADDAIDTFLKITKITIVHILATNIMYSPHISSQCSQLM